MIDRYLTKEMKMLWSEEHKYQNMLKVEIASTHAFSLLGIIPEEDYLKIKSNATFNIDRIHELENETKHDVIAFTRCIDENLGDEKKWVHYGLTSTDVVDTAQSITLKEVNDIIEQDLISYMDILKTLSFNYKDTPCIGRTHGIHAEVMSFGLKFARFYAEASRNLERFKSVRTKIEVGKISGAVGNYANISPLIEDKVCEELKLGKVDIATQVLPRDLHIEYINVLALIASSLENAATEIRNLSRTEISEVKEGFGKNQKGSSAMPHKKNPVSCENICGLSRVVRSYVNVAYENNILWHERDISHSSSERIILADSSSLISYMLRRMTSILKNLDIYKDKMLENINLTNGIIFSGRVLNKMVEKNISREEAYDKIQALAMISLNQNINFKTLLLNDEMINKALKTNEIEECFDLDYYLKETNYIYNKVFKE